MLNTLIVTFQNELARDEVSQFRGAVVRAVGEACPVLFHNHTDEGYRYRYPLIQYKCIGGRAAIVCVGEGTAEVGAFFCTADFDLRIGMRKERFEIEAVCPFRTEVRTWDHEFRYTLRDWLPLNRDNYRRYRETEDVADRVLMLEHIAVGNMLSVCKGLGIVVGGEISCHIVQMEPPRPVLYKGTPMVSVSCQLKSNLSLPSYIGLGKGASRGHGVLAMMD